MLFRPFSIQLNYQVRAIQPTSQSIPTATSSQQQDSIVNSNIERPNLTPRNSNGTKRSHNEIDNTSTEQSSMKKVKQSSTNTDQTSGTNVPSLEGVINNGCFFVPIHGKVKCKLPLNMDGSSLRFALFSDLLKRVVYLVPFKENKCATISLTRELYNKSGGKSSQRTIKFAIIKLGNTKAGITDHQVLFSTDSIKFSSTHLVEPKNGIDKNMQIEFIPQYKPSVQFSNRLMQVHPLYSMQLGQFRYPCMCYQPIHTLPPIPFPFIPIPFVWPVENVPSNQQNPPIVIDLTQEDDQTSVSTESE